MTFRRFLGLVGMPIPDSQPESPTDAQSDSQVVRRVLAGDVDAFSLLVDRHHARCLRVATHLLCDGDDADDAVQEAFVRAYRHLGSYRERDRFGAWLLRVVVNRCRTNSARARRWSGAESMSIELLPSAESSHDDAVEAIERAARYDELALALSRLGPAHREAIVLRFSDELSYDEMAMITGVGVSALKMRVQRACAQLRALLSEHLYA